MDSRQAAAIARRKREARVDRDLATERDRLALAMPLDGGMLPADPMLVTVGWKLPDPSTAKGIGHLCIGCRPERPGFNYQPVLRMQLAARSTCTQCGTVLETLVSQAVTGSEKK